MQTRQELILDFMKSMAATEMAVKVAQTEPIATQKAFVRDIFLLAAIFADKYLETV